MATPIVVVVVVPEDVIVEILSWLPVKSLLRFRCVCKSWLSIITNQSFVTKHLQHYYHHQNVRLLLGTHTGSRFALRLFSDPTLADTTTFDDLGFSSSELLSFDGPCNGIVCVCNDLDRLALWNPATRDFRPLPKFHPPDFPSKRHLSTYNVGFGLDLTTGDFKAVWIRKFYIDNEDDDGLPPTYSYHVAVYTLSTDSWREFDQGNHRFSDLDVLPGGNSYTYLNGTYYWRAVRGGHDLVLAFDMATDTFRDIPGPDGLPNSSGGILVVYQGSLTRLHVDDTHPVTSIDFWVMMQYQEEGEGYCCSYYWTKKLSVQSVSGVAQLCGGGIWNNHLLFVLTSSEHVLGFYRLGLYDLDTDEIKDMGLPELHWFEALMYKDSLVSVKGSNHSIRVPDFGIPVPNNANADHDHDANDDYHTNDDWYDELVVPKAFY